MEGFPLLLVGNKCDEESGKRQVSAKTGEALEVNIIQEYSWTNLVCFTENVESEIHRNLSQKQCEYQRTIWGDFQVGEEQSVVTSANRRHGEEEEEMLYLLIYAKMCISLQCEIYAIYEWNF